MSVWWKPEGCVLWLDFAELRGDTVYDLSGSGNHGTVHGATWRRGPLIGALEFDGVDDCVLFPRPHSFATSVQGSWEVLVRLDTIPDRNGKILNPGTARLDINLEGNTGRVFVWFTDANNVGHLVWKAPDDRYADGAWHHFVVSKDDEAIRVYADGELVREFATTSTTYTDMDRGSIMATPTLLDHCPGRVALVRVYDRALTEREIRAHYRYLMKHVAPRPFPRVA